MSLSLNDIRLEDLGKAARSLLEFSGSHKCIAFYGDMGAGKTTFIQAICRELGVTEHVSSPTFSLVNEYRDKSDQPVFHFDFYRINNENEAVDIGCEEYFSSGHLCLIEWPEKILNLLPHPLVKVVIEINKEARRLTFSYD